MTWVPDVAEHPSPTNTTVDNTLGASYIFDRQHCVQIHIS
jgi:hypothetical protein